MAKIDAYWTTTMEKTYIACHRAKTSAFSACLAEWNGFSVSFELVRKETKPLNGIPVTLITRDPKLQLRPGMSEEAIKKDQVKLEKLIGEFKEDIPHIKHVIADNSSHCIQLHRPDVIVQEKFNR